ncbi:MAG: hypothetical protein A3C93_02175 [Candidatus Lloydbacteria bacterium RIFCSPHIGHO2_02_FULL_54_17]|uniref:Nudix hydrolase domain-containing protein n=1 Tax=Candidatus Lloydbacteria bacterium RIFCSPHIGHO2_02_FULL_54_17 TaxID=1798664 RepID=A0A1G2DFJ6_9BACT|nr:MAG: hypothetical protein A2762_02235 [Candidatus Lloydbacteria bacterium RIFCSPHIGHO2_01_FULL_54_11]OGZ11721.1 MAG: hypothetical protein A3C93_02175 [Candidatus Lloydbacteria bacterium RIFCSPHIGHO2_02_FULL_54_17]OGZ14250.1 MAG: hypothetical protein A2948_01510 [Candidatus Lloydbacteria bacterium RIFCSPLOWO2_01_FULL_54_18]OGZ16595.1 MAG: hypothetical protein A3H76_04150 [Candidatus Lloydbacteria bacterium RIFCSPLOWO2_02_FULL_54_12]
MPHGTNLLPKEIPPCFYRVSAKALILDETRTKFLVVQEQDGRWELPGGGIDHGEEATETLKREIKEEMGLEVLHVASQPAYLMTFLNVTGYWMGNALYETTVKDLNFTPSDECVALRFVTPTEAKALNAFPNVAKFAGVFDPKRHG